MYRQIVLKAAAIMAIAAQRWQATGLSKYAYLYSPRCYNWRYACTDSTHNRELAMEY